jgi:hypothetical protein
VHSLCSSSQGMAAGSNGAKPQAALLEEQSSGELARTAALSISRTGFYVCRGGIDTSVVSAAGREVDALYRRGAMVGGKRPCFLARRPAYRDDYTLWLREYLKDDEDRSDEEASNLLFLDRALARFGEAVIDALGDATADTWPMGCSKNGEVLHYTARTDLMCAYYPVGASYGPHIDNISGDGREPIDHGRCFTCVYYLNSTEWDTSTDGGGLRIHYRHDGLLETDVRCCDETVTVEPSGDTLVIFRADRVLHEVLPARTQRMAATMWLHAGTLDQRQRLLASSGGSIGIVNEGW